MASSGRSTLVRVRPVGLIGQGPNICYVIANVIDRSSFIFIFLPGRKAPSRHDIDHRHYLPSVVRYFIQSTLDTCHTHIRYVYLFFLVFYTPSSQKLPFYLLMLFVFI